MPGEAATQETTQETKKPWVTAQVEPEIQEAIRRIAKQENRSVSAQIRQFIMEGIERRQVKREQV